MEGIRIPEGKKKGKYKRIGAKVGRVVIIMQAISILMVMLVCIFMYNTLVTKMQKDRCTNGTNMLAYELSQMSEDQDPNELLDELKSRMRCEFTIFEGDTRAYSTVTQDGKRVVGTQLSSELNEIVLQQGNTYVASPTYVFPCCSREIHTLEKQRSKGKVFCVPMYLQKETTERSTD